MFRLVLLAFVWVFCARNACAKSPDDEHVFALRPLPLAQAIGEFAEQTGVSIAFDADAMDGLISGAVYGRDSITNGLTRLLIGTGYTFAATGRDTIVISLRAAVAQADENRSNGNSKRAALKRANTIETLFITANQRSQDVQSLAASVSAVSGSRLEQLSVERFNDVAVNLSGIAFTNLGRGRNKIFIRGISDGSISDRTQSTVGVYLDETPLIFNDPQPEIQLIDMERLEVIRGPQTTLYGAGTLAGVYRMVANKPVLDETQVRLNASMALTQHGQPSWGLSGTMNMPLISNRLGVRVSAYRDHRGGYLDNPQLGAQNTNDETTIGTRVALRFQPSKRWTLDVSGLIQDVDLADSQYVFGSPKSLSRDLNTAEPYSDLYALANITVSADLPWAQLTSTASYTRRRYASTFDATLALPLLLEEMATSGEYLADSKTQSFTLETRFVSKTNDRFNWLVGGSFWVREEDLSNTLSVDQSGTVASPFVSTRRDQLRDLAFFGEASLRAVGGLWFTAGLRWADRSLDVNVEANGLETNTPPSFSDLQSAATVSPSVGVSYVFDDTVLLFAQATRGSRLGGLNVNTPLAALFQIDADDDITRFESDVLWHTELGLKTTLFDSRFLFNVSAFHVFWREIQTDQILPNGFSFVTNAGDSRNYGVEVEAEARPLPGLSVFASAVWNGARLTEANAFLGAEKGIFLPNTTRLSASVNLSWDFAVTPEWAGRVTAGTAFTGRSFLTFAGEDGPKMGNFQQTNLSLLLRRETISLSLRVDNLTNTRANTFAFGNPFSFSQTEQSTPLRPRTVAVEMSLRF